jgi:hypothetical protein
MMIWDLHCHITERLGGRTPDESMARLISLSDRMGIERLVIYMGDKAVVDPPQTSCAGRMTRFFRLLLTGITARSDSYTSVPNMSKPVCARSIGVSATDRWSV